MELQHNITYRKKDKGWQFIISYKDYDIGKWKQKAKQGFKSKQEAKRAADKALEAIKEAIKSTKNLNLDYSEITFSEFYEIYKQDNDLYQTAATISNMKYSVNSFKALLDFPLKSIKTKDVQNIIDDLYRKGRTQKTIESKVGYIKILFNSAVKKYKILNVSPCDDIKLKKNKTIIKRRALDDEEVKALLSKLKHDKEKYYIVSLIAVTAGLRIGEILGLTKDDILNNGIDINKQFKDIGNGICGLGPLKSRNSNRIIPVPEITIKEIRNYMFNNKPAEDGRIFNFGEKRSFQTVLNKRMKSLGFNVCLHELRHTYATKLIASGVDFKTAAYILGHDVKETMNTYTHVTDSMLMNAKNIINSNFENLDI